MMRFVSVILYVIIIFFGVSFAAINAKSVQLNLYVKQISMPISILVVASLALGFIIGFLCAFFRHFRQKLEIKQLQSKLSIAEKEIKNLRSIPLSNDH